MFNLSDYKKIHMIGIGGISMSAIAEYLVNKNYIVSGSDRTRSDLTDYLESKNIKIYIGHDARNIDESIDLIIYTPAIHEDNPEIIRAKELNIKIINRAEVLGYIMQDYKYSIAVAGSHGKTTVTAMISQILIEAEKDPTIFLGGILNLNNKNFRLGSSDYFITEACEYKDSFLNFYPYMSVINNIDLDHIDYFKNIDQIKNSFKKFIYNTKDNGFIVINQRDKDLVKNIKSMDDIKREIVIFDYNDRQSKKNWHAENIIFDENQFPTFDVVQKKTVIKNIRLNIPGRYNILNALAAISACHKLDIDLEIIKRALENFHGAQRRFEFKGFYNGAKIFDDYAHHPNELKETILTAKKMPHNKLWCIFQPHTYSRTKMFFNEFAKALSSGENIILVDIYSAREDNIYDIDSSLLARQTSKFGCNAIYLSSFEETANYIKSKVQENDLVLTIGAGDVYKIADKILDPNKNN